MNAVVLILSVVSLCLAVTALALASYSLGMKRALRETAVWNVRTVSTTPAPTTSTPTMTIGKTEAT